MHVLNWKQSTRVTSAPARVSNLTSTRRNLLPPTWLCNPEIWHLGSYITAIMVYQISQSLDFDQAAIAHIKWL